MHWKKCETIFNEKPLENFTITKNIFEVEIHFQNLYMYIYIGRYKSI